MVSWLTRAGLAAFPRPLGLCEVCPALAGTAGLGSEPRLGPAAGGVAAL